MSYEDIKSPVSGSAAPDVPAAVNPKFLAVGNALDAQDTKINSNTAQLQNCLVELKDVVAVVSHKGISSNVVGKNVIDKGGKVLDGDGVSFVKTPEGFYTGGEYENLFLEGNISLNQGATGTYIGDNVFEITKTVEGDAYFGLRGLAFEVSKHYTLRYEFITEDYISNDVSMGAFVRLHSLTFETQQDGFGVNGSLTSKCISNENMFGSFVILRSDIPVGSKIKIKIQTTDTQNKVPFVPVAFRGGELKIDEPWTSETHTFMFLDVRNNFNLANTPTLYYCNENNTGHGLTERFAINLGDSPAGDAIISKTIKKGFLETGEETVINGWNTSTTKGSVQFSRTFDKTGFESVGFGTLVVFKGDLGEKALEIRDIIKSGNYKLQRQFQGTTFPIEGMVRRMEKYGIVNPYIFAAAERLLAYTGEDHDFEVLVEGESALKVVSVTAGVSSDPSVIRVDGNEIVANVNLKKFRRM